jgi:hypothetical protein
MSAGGRPKKTGTGPLYLPEHGSVSVILLTFAIRKAAWKGVNQTTTVKKWNF